jgi:glyoxylase-like metal-dependent hydrolase (beta-lactamase superfamily II)
MATASAGRSNGFQRVGAGLLTAIAVLALASPAPAEDFPRLSRLADGVYTYEQIDPTKRGVTVNNLIVVTSDGVLVADGQGTADNTARLVADVAAITPQPIRYVVVGSVHGDHRGGDKAFPPGATFITSARDLTLGGHEIRVVMLGRAHTGSDLEVLLPREKIMYMSESFSNRIFPSLANGYPSEWIAALQQAERMDVDVYVPAHATMAARALVTSRDEVHVYRQALETVVAEGRRLHDAHVPVDTAASSASFGDLGAWTRAAENAPGALKRIYMELDGQLPARN